MSKRILPKYVTFVMEDRPLLRVVEVGGNVIDYEIKPEYLANLALLALSLSLRKTVVTQQPAKTHHLPPLTGEEQGA